MIHFLKIVAKNRLAAFGGILLLIIITLSILAPILPLKEPNITNTADRFMTPFEEGHILGTDHLGRDLLSRLLWGTQLSLAVGFAAAFIAATFGSILGAIAGFYGQKTDNIIMRFIDMLMAFPYILLALAIVAALGPGLFNALIAVALVNIPFFARNIRGVTVTLANKEFIEAARLSGMSNLRILIVEIFPNLLPMIVIAMSTTVGWMILETAGLSFLGLGSQPPQADLGSMLGEARSALITNPHTSFVPGIMIFCIVIGINLFGDGVRDALDPRLKKGSLIRPLPQTIYKEGDTQPTPSTKLLSVQNLSTQFHVNQDIYQSSNDVSFEIQEGECLGLIGESGSGKSVTALSVTSLVASPPGVIKKGSVNYKNQNLLALPYEELRSIRGNKISYIFQDPLTTLHPLHTIGDQLLEALNAHDSKLSASESISKSKELLKSVQIPNPDNVWDVYPHQLSGGMRQRVCIAMALINDPELIIADEPTTALDVTVQAQILNILNSLRKERKLSILFISHDFGVISQLCDRVIVMYAGSIVEEGPVKNIMQQAAHPYTSELIKCVPQLGNKEHALHSIPGNPPSLNQLPEGCAFANRCQYKQDQCLKGAVPVSSKDNRSYKCFYPVGGVA
ncbi:dipeptide/oligopeptide/nickel ABC transporter permease/ATP-binding protein [Alphaproteobacteria bacterium]|nr:dipeptide/oligopeptide/nickel ABC transporter permease/ATP-binding protein [Alphaproteobacteria bacterium]